MAPKKRTSEKSHFSAEYYRLNPVELREQEIHTLDNDHWIPLFTEHILDHPYTERLFSQTGSEVGVTYQEPTLKKVHHFILYNEFYNQEESQNQIWVSITAGNEHLTCVYSCKKKYTEDELSMMCIIQPHLETAWKNWQHLRSLKQKLDVLTGSIFQSKEEEAAAAQMRKRIESLTARQREVVELVAHGRDNQQIAAALKISVLTVKKHLQMVFQSMDVLHRTQLAAQWHQAHSVTLY